MFLRIYKTNQTYLILLIPITAILLWLSGFFNNNFEIITESFSLKMPLYELLKPYINASIYWSLITAIVLALVQAFYLSNLNKSFIFIKQRSYLHSFIFLIIISSSLITKFATPAIFANFFILFSINWLFQSFKKAKPNQELFNSGLFLSIAGLFYINSFFLLPMYIIAYIVLHTIKLKEILVIIYGFLAPILIVAGILFINDTLFIYTNNIWHYFSNTNYNIEFTIFDYLFYGWLIFLLLISIINFSNNFGTKKISSRKYLSIFLYLIIYNIAMYIFLPFSNMEVLVITAAPISFIITDFYINIRNKFLAEISFTLLIIFFVLTQFFLTK